MNAAKTSPTDPRPCTVCGDLILLAKSSVSGNWRPFSAFPADDMLRPFAWVLIGTQAWPKTDLIEHYMVTRELGEAKARDLVEDYPHHLLHPAHDEGDAA